MRATRRGPIQAWRRSACAAEASGEVVWAKHSSSTKVPSSAWWEAASEAAGARSCTPGCRWCSAHSMAGARAVDGGGNAGAWSAFTTFSTSGDNGSPRPPVPVSPLGETFTTQDEVVLSWTASVDPDGDRLTYEVEVLESGAVVQQAADIDEAAEGVTRW